MWIGGIGCFNPRSRGASDIKHCAGNNRLTGFNPRSRGASDYAIGFLETAIKTFQSTLARGERLNTTSSRLKQSRSFNPRSRGASDRCFFAKLIVRPQVSIHARAGRATYHGADCVQPGYEVSIHARAGRATEICRHGSPPRLWFQSTLARGERHDNHSFFRTNIDVSIHARAGRATRARRSGL